MLLLLSKDYIWDYIGFVISLVKEIVKVSVWSNDIDDNFSGYY